MVVVNLFQAMKPRSFHPSWSRWCPLLVEQGSSSAGGRASFETKFKNQACGCGRAETRRGLKPVGENCWAKDGRKVEDEKSHDLQANQDDATPGSILQKIARQPPLAGYDSDPASPTAPAVMREGCRQET